jgi:hypothetical protein
MEFMDASIDAFYKVMHEQDKLECDKLEQLLRRIVHDVSLILLQVIDNHGYFFL